MPIKILILDKDPIWHAIKDLQNRVAILEGRKPPHEAFCRACNGTGEVETLISKDSDTLVKVCKFCKGEGK